jgi:translation initiation factor 2A
MWNAPSTACLFMATCETDATNQSYYGESKLHYLPAEADRGDAACAVQMPKDGPVHDVQWSPAGDFFVVVAGFMPAKVKSAGSKGACIKETLKDSLYGIIL